MSMITVLNSDTTYGVDGSAANNYGLGTQFMSSQALATVQAAQSSAPSIWWLVGAVALVWMVL